MSRGVEAVIILRLCASLSHGSTLLLFEREVAAKLILLPPHQIREADVWLLRVSLAKTNNPALDSDSQVVKM